MKSLLIQTAALAFGLAIVVTVMTAAPRLAAAKPEFASQTGKPCGFCHVKPSGGLPLNPTGEKFKKNGFKL